MNTTRCTGWTRHSETIKECLVFTHYLGWQAGWRQKILCWLPQTKLSDSERCLSPTSCYLDSWSLKGCSLSLGLRHKKCLLANSSRRVKQREDTFTIQGRGLFHFNILPFGLHNAPATWQRLVDNVLGMDLEPYVFVYLDDVILVTQTFEKLVEVLEEIFKRLAAANLTINKEKCHFCKSELRYLGYVVDAKGLKVDPEKVNANSEIPVPYSCLLYTSRCV